MINGLKGSNVKLSSKPPLPPKCKQTSQSVTFNGRNFNCSPYLPTTIRPHTTATSFRERNNVSKPPMPWPPRKHSEPAIKQFKPPISTTKAKLSPIQQRLRQHQQQVSEFDDQRSETSSSTPRRPYSKYIPGNQRSYLNPLTRPSTAPRDYSSGCSSPQDDPIEMMMRMGDVESFENFVDYENEKNSTCSTKPIRSRFSFASASCGSFDFNTLSLDLDIAEQPEKYLNDDNTNFSNLDEAGDRESRLMKNRDTPTKERSVSREECQSEKDFVHSKNSSTPNRSFDNLLLSESNTLLHDVVKLCDEIGLDSSVIEKIKNSSRFNSPEKRDGNCTPIMQNLVVDDEGEELSNMSCPSTVRNRTSGEDSARSFLQNEMNCNDEPSNDEKNNVPVSSRPASCNSSSTGSESEDTYTRILSVLRHIEAEEKKSTNNVEIIMKSPTDESIQLAGSNGDRIELSSPRHQNKEELNDSDDDYNDLIPHMPRLNVPSTTKSCSCSSEQCESARSQAMDNATKGNLGSPRSGVESRVNLQREDKIECDWENADQKTKNLFSFLDEVEKSDRETLFTLKFDQSPRILGPNSVPNANTASNIGRSNKIPHQTMDTLIRKGSVELAREVIILERKLDETQHNINLLEETLINQRELNIRNLKSSERDLKKRLKLQQEEFELALSRHQTFVDQLIGEKRSLQDKCEKVLRESKENEQKLQEQIRGLHEKHLEEIKRIRKVQQNTENVKRQKWVGNKTQEIRDLTVKGLEPELQRIIQRHQQEMSEMRAWHSDELRESEERYVRKNNMQLQELREKFMREKEEACRRERELTNKRFESELKQREDDFESQKRRLINDLNEERERYACDEIKMKDSMQENVRKAQIKGEVEVNSLRQEYETKINNADRRHENELKSLKDIYGAEKENWVSNYTKKYEQALAERESQVGEATRIEKEREIRDREKKLRDEFDKLRMEDEEATESRIKRLQEKFHSELEELEKSERDLKCRLSQAKADLLVKDEEIFTLKTTLNLKEKSNCELSESNIKMIEERANLTSVIRREFACQIETLEEDCRSVKSSVLEMQAKHKLDLEQHQMELGKIRNDKESELEKVGLRVKQTLIRKEETLQELQKQLEKASYRINHLEELLEQQRKDFVQSMTVGSCGNSVTKRK